MSRVYLDTVKAYVVSTSYSALHDALTSMFHLRYSIYYCWQCVLLCIVFDVCNAFVYLVNHIDLPC